MSTHTIFDELSQLANQLGIKTNDCHNIKDILRRMTAVHGGNSNGRAIADAVKHLKFTLPFQIADAPTALAIANVTLTPSYDDDVYSYIGAVDGESESGALTVTKASGTDVTITFNGEEVETGDTLEFVNGANVLVVTVTQDDVAPVTYTITFPFQRVAKDLTALSIGNVTFDPTFSGSTYEYDGTVAAGYLSGALAFTAAANNTATATFNGEAASSGDTLTFVEGDNELTVTVSREDSESKVYTVDIPWVPPYADDLTALEAANITLDPTFAANTYTYSGTIAEGETTGSIAWTAAANTTVVTTFNGEAIASGETFTFVEGNNVIEITVSREGYKDRVYTITIPNAPVSEGGEG